MKTKNYKELKQRQEKEIGSFDGVFFAFSDSQFADGMRSVGLDAEDTKKVYSFGAGGYIKRDRFGAFQAMFAKHKMELKQLKKDEKQLYGALLYELRNHEYCITGNPTEALHAIGCKEIDKSMLERACKEAEKVI